MSRPRSLNLRDPVDAQPAAVRFQDLVLAFSQLIRVSSLLLSIIVLSIEPASLFTCFEFRAETVLRKVSLCFS
jgi:hypothetical protein